jgi:protein-disulfide isomerase
MLAARFAGIPQAGDALGSRNAPYTLFEFADLQCPYCGRYDRDVLPAVIREFVRPGLLRLEFHPIVLIGPESEPAAAAALAAGEQNRMWQFADLFYRNQQPENSGYVTWPFIKTIAAAVPGMSITALRRASGTAPIASALRQNIALARSGAVTGTPDFRFGHTGGVLRPFLRGAWPRSAFLVRLWAAVRRTS